jgi:hypothetical protein
VEKSRFAFPQQGMAANRYIRFCRGEIQHSNQLERFEKITFKKMVDK